MKASWALALLLLGGSAGPGGMEDDLAVVRKATAGADKPDQAEARPAPRSGKEPQWLRVRILDRGKKKVSINLPLALVRAVGEDVPLDLHCRRCSGRRGSLTLGQVLRALDSGQDIVQIDDDEASVRVWVE